MFGYGRTVRTSLQQVYGEYFAGTPTQRADQAVAETFRLKHVPPSSDPINRPGGYERARDAAVAIARQYETSYDTDVDRLRPIEARVDIPAAKCVITGSIDLLLREEEQLLGIEIIDFRAMEGGDAPQTIPELDLTELSLQVQLYARADAQILGENARTGNVRSRDRRPNGIQMAQNRRRLLVNSIRPEPEIVPSDTRKPAPRLLCSWPSKCNTELLSI